MIPPKEFEKRLREDFDGRLRLRWSLGKRAWMIEQKFRPVVVRQKVDERDDAAIRTRDGYTLVATIAPGDRIPCVRCGRTLKIPSMTFKETVCQCGVSTTLCYWPLGESLLDYLKKYDPYRDGIHRLERELLDYEAKRAKQERRDQVNLAEDVASDTITQWFGIQSVGYTGKEFTHGSV